MRLVFVDGPPGAGKSTVLEALRTQHGVLTYPEPQEHWAPVLQDMERLTGREWELAVLQLQAMVLSWYQTLASVLAAADSDDDEVVAVERSPQSAKVFHALATDAPQCSDELKRRLASIADQLPEMPPSVTVHLLIDPPLAAERTSQRQAAGDSGWTASAIQAYYTHYDRVIEDDVLTIKLYSSTTPSAVAAKLYSLIK